jgi:hypothetical protein
MKRLSFVLFTLFIAMLITVSAMAADQMLDTKIESVTVAMTKHDAEYVRFIITEPRTLDGVTYNRSLPVMAFGELVAAAKAYKSGDNLKAVVSYRKLDDGRESYSILAFIQ